MTTSNITIFQAEAFNQDDFADQLKLARLHAGLSQSELAHDLAASHVLFSNLSQAMISLWEKGHSQPSLLRRVGLATFFERQYEFSGSEVRSLKRASRHKLRQDRPPTAYAYSIDHVEDKLLSKCSDYIRTMARDSHQNSYGISLDETLRTLKADNPRVLAYFHNNALVGHAVYQRIAPDHFVHVSNVSLDNRIWRTMMIDMERIAGPVKVTAFAADPSVQQAFEDIYFRPLFTLGTLKYYQGDMEKLSRNPFYLASFYGNTTFQLLRYDQVRNANEK